MPQRMRKKLLFFFFFFDDIVLKTTWNSSYSFIWIKRPHPHPPPPFLTHRVIRLLWDINQRRPRVKLFICRSLRSLNVLIVFWTEKARLFTSELFPLQKGIWQWRKRQILSKLAVQIPEPWQHVNSPAPLISPRPASALQGILQSRADGPEPAGGAKVSVRWGWG